MGKRRKKKKNKKEKKKKQEKKRKEEEVKKASPPNTYLTLIELKGSYDDDHTEQKSSLNKIINKNI